MVKKERTRLAYAFGMAVGSGVAAVTVSVLRGSMSVGDAAYALAAGVVCAGAGVSVLGLARSRAKGPPDEH